MHSIIIILSTSFENLLCVRNCSKASHQWVSTFDYTLESITLGSLPTPTLRPHSWPITSELLGVGFRNWQILKLHWWFQSTGKAEHRSSCALPLFLEETLLCGYLTNSSKNNYLNRCFQCTLNSTWNYLINIQAKAKMFKNGFFFLNFPLEAHKMLTTLPKRSM